MAIASNVDTVQGVIDSVQEEAAASSAKIRLHVSDKIRPIGAHLRYNCEMLGGLSNPFLLKFSPWGLKIIPPHNTIEGDWVVGNDVMGNNTLFDTEWIQCYYQTSGNYAPTPRYTFYALLFFCVGTRHVTWLATAALGSIMVYSTVAAVHAIVLFLIRNALIPNYKYIMDHYQVVLVQGQSTSGLLDLTGDGSSAGSATSLWLPVLPMAWDSDIHPILAIVGASCLVLLPMQMWSRTVQATREKAILVLWDILLMCGMICGVLSAIYVSAHAFPQLRFCPHNQNDTLPLSNDGTQKIGSPWHHSEDRYHWNRTIRHHFATNATDRLSNLCIYPCFQSSWPLRDPTDIYVLPGSSYEPARSAADWLLIVIQLLIIATAFSSTIMAIVTQYPQTCRKLGMNFDLTPNNDDEDAEHRNNNGGGGGGSTNNGIFPGLRGGIAAHLEQVKRTWTGNDPLLRWSIPPAPLWLRLYHFPVVGLRIYFLLSYIYTMLLSPFALVFYLVYFEWFMSQSDPGGESFRHVGQWSTLVASMLVIFAAVYPHMLSNHGPNQCQCRCHRSTV